MAAWLKQSTAKDVALGPFVDSTDGFTPETALSLTQAECRLKKNDGAWAQKNEATTGTHEEEGWYEIKLNATDTDTLGILILAIYVAGALPVWREFLVVPANVYDAFLAADFLQVDLREWVGVAPSALITGRVDSNVQAMAAGVITASVAPNLDAAVSSRASQASLDTLDDYVDTEVAAIKAKTDQLTFTGVNKVDASLRDWVGGTPNALISGRVDANAQVVGDKSGYGVTSLGADVITAASLAVDAANEIADALLKRDMSAVTGEAARSPLNALRKLMNKTAIALSVLTIYKEDDTTIAFTQSVATQAGAEPIIGLDTA